MSRWNAEWQTWRADPGAPVAVARWAERYPCLSGLTELDEVVAACGEDRAVALKMADERLVAVVTEAGAGDRFAARVALHRVFPGLVRRAAARAASYQRPLGMVLEDLMAAAWLVIVEFPLDRRPSKIAVNVVRDAENRIFGYIPRVVREAFPIAVENLSPRDLGTARSGPSVDPDPQDSVDLAPKLLLDAVDRGLSVQDAWLLGQLFVADLSVTDLAEREGVSSRWVRMRRQWALERLAALVGPDPRVVRGGNACSNAAADVTFRVPVVQAHE